MLHLDPGWAPWLGHASLLLSLLLGVVGIILLDDVNTVTTKTIMPGVVDNFFRAGPTIAYLKGRFTRCG